MKVIYKYKLPLSGCITMPVGARILSVAGQHGEMCLWALVDTENPPEKRQFLAIGTGQNAATAEYGIYVGQYRNDDEHEVYHIFELNLSRPSSE